jgi:lipopolysaccharide transport system ATP-binding protein
MSWAIQLDSVGKTFRREGTRALSHSFRESVHRQARQALRAANPASWFRGGDGSGKDLFWAVRDVSAEIREGEIVGVIGPNGAGKTTLLKLLSRITPPTCGTIRYRGRLASLLEVGTGFHRELSGRENIYLSGAILGMRRWEITQRLDDIIDFSGVGKFIDTPVKFYSSGMYVRLAFAVAAHLQADVLLLDEVLAVGDVAFQRQSAGKMETVARSGRTVVLVSHNMDAIRRLCSRVYVIREGRLVYTGDALSAIQWYLQTGTHLAKVYRVPRPSDENAAGWFEEIVVENAKGEPTTDVMVGQGWQLRVRFTVTQALPHAMVAVGMVSEGGVPLRTSWSAPEDLPAGNYEAVFRENHLIFGPGQYSMTLGLSSLGHAIHYAENAAMLNVAPMSDTLKVPALAGVGLLFNPMDITISRRPAP